MKDNVAEIRENQNILPSVLTIYKNVNVSGGTKKFHHTDDYIGSMDAEISIQDIDPFDDEPFLINIDRMRNKNNDEKHPNPTVENFKSIGVFLPLDDVELLYAALGSMINSKKRLMAQYPETFKNE